MIFEFKNLGAIKEAQIEMGRLTVISGKNNTGKTYLTYAVWGAFNAYFSYMYSDYQFSLDNKIIEELNKHRKSRIDFNKIKEDAINFFRTNIKIYQSNIANVFDTHSDYFFNFQIDINKIEIDYKRAIETYIYANDYRIELKKGYGSSIFDLFLIKEKDILLDVSVLPQIYELIAMRTLCLNHYIFTAQRDALHLFKNSIEKGARYRLREGGNDRDNKYSLPIEYQIDFISRLSKYEKQKSYLHEMDLITEIEQILGVKYQIHYDSFQVENANGVATPAFMASTSVRTLADLHFYLKHIAQKGDLLMIDEPELNLHPENQIKIARLLVKLVNAGIRVWITTHSDYIVKELNNCLMLSNDFTDKEAFMQEYEYKENDILKKEDIRVYIAHEEGTVEQVEIGKFGMKKTTFDDAIKRFNEVSDTLFNILG